MKYVLTALIALFAATQTLAATDRLGLRTFVIDAGHGGKDPGAVSADGKDYEKTFTLRIAKELSRKVFEKYPDVKVIMTRTDDSFVSLNRRAEIANKAGADLFMSIHINSSSESSANGYSVHVLGKSHKPNTDIFRLNLDMVKRENCVITLDDDYNPETAGFDPRNPESYIFMTMMQSAYLEQSIRFAQEIMLQLNKGPFHHDRGVSQDPFYVLWKTSMPSVLAELGFISNRSDLAALKDSRQIATISDALFAAFVRYKESYDASMSISDVHQEKTEVSKNPAPAPKEKEGKMMYGVQIFTVGSEISEGDPRLLGYKPLIIKSNGKYRHIIGASGNREEALKVKQKVASKYPDAYIVQFEKR